MKACFCAFYLLLCPWLQGQNLLKNPGFEEYYYLQDLLNRYGECYVDSAFICQDTDWIFYDRCFNRVWAIDTVLVCKNWYKIRGSSPDYFRVDARNRSYGIHRNHVGYYPPAADSAYMGFLPLSLSGYANPLTGEFAAPLEAGKRYEVSFFYCFANHTSDFYLDKIEAFVSTDNWITQNALYQRTYVFIYEYFMKNNVVANVVFETPLVNDGQWHKMVGYYQAQGGEKYLSFGIFCQDEKFTKILNEYRRKCRSFPQQNPPWTEKFFQKYQNDLFIHRTSHDSSQRSVGAACIEYPACYFMDDVSVVEVH